MTTSDLAQEAAVNRYCIAAAKLRLDAFTYIDEGRDTEAEGALALARICERAAEAEDLNPPPRKVA